MTMMKKNNNNNRRPITTIVVCAIVLGAKHAESFVMPKTATVAAAVRPFFATRPEVDNIVKEDDTTTTIDLDQELSVQIKAKMEANSYDPLELNHDVMGVIHPTIDEDEDDKLGIWTARLILLAVAAIWGTNFGSVKYLETLCFHPPCNHPPSEFAFARFGVAGLVSLPLLIGQRWDVILAGIECGIWISLGYIAQAMALSTIPSGECAFLCSLTVVVVPVISALFFGKKITPINIVSGAIALSGVAVLEGMLNVPGMMGIAPAVAMTSSNAAMMETATNAATNIASSSLTEASAGPLSTVAHALGVTKGDVLALGQPFGFGFSFIRIEHYVEKFKDVDNRILTISAAQCVAVGLLALAWVLYDYHGVLPNFGYLIEPHRIAAIAWTGIVTTVGAIYLEGVALQTASATEAALTFSSEPVWASLFAAWLLHERLGVDAFVGGAIILSACVLGAVSDLRAENIKAEKKKDKEEFAA